MIGQGPGSDWTLIVSPSLRRQDLVPHLVGKIAKILTEMGLYGSVWVDIEGIRSHMGYKGSDIGRRDLVWCIILNLGLDGILFFLENFF